MKSGEAFFIVIGELELGFQHSLFSSAGEDGFGGFRVGRQPSFAGDEHIGNGESALGIAIGGGADEP
jgi:hypothetical protein